MLRGILPKLALILLLMSGWALAGCIQSAEADGPVYIRADGSIDPPTTSMEHSGNVYTLTGNITSVSDGIIVERDNVVLDGSGFTVKGSGQYNSSGICLFGRSNVTITDINIKNFACGIRLTSSWGNCIGWSTIANNNEEGIVLVDSSNGNSLNGNTIANNGYDGVFLGSSMNNNISGNTMVGNTYTGLSLGSSSNNSICGNAIAGNGYDGLYLVSSSNNTIKGNTIAEGGSYGVRLSFSSYNSIDGNTITDNGIGIGLVETSGNFIFHNNFNNTFQIDNRQSGQTDFWDNKCEGNYWSNYNGIDTDADGVGDTLLPWEGVDSCPLMNLYWSPSDINHDLIVDMNDLGASAVAYGTRVGDDLWNPHVDITGLEPLVPDGKVNMRDISLIARHFGEHCA